ncbi:MAG: ABC transporter permease [Leptolyngbya sp. PLA3]|nr:MAG: ABC transporter permease [Cyanobacteria bacterium CYA]MCE7968115.1 ABC transporter permease [Leptolyngbya sp. PL-A3]
MWAYIIRKLVYNIPVYLGIILLTMAALRVRDPVAGYLGKNATPEQIELLTRDMGLDDPFMVQYGRFLWQIVRFDFSEESWAQPGRSVRSILIDSIPPSMSITLPQVAASALLAMVIALISAYFRGRLVDKALVFLAVLGMSISYLVYIVFGQFFGAFLPQHLDWDVQPFAIQGYLPWLTEPWNWVTYCLLPVMIGVVVAIGYDTRFYRAVMVEESSRDYIVTATAKGATKPKIMFVHMLKNAMIPIITRIMATLPFLITGSILLEMYFNIPGMGRQLITALIANDFPVIQAFVSVLALLFILSIILTDVLYALVDPRVRLS